MNARPADHPSPEVLRALGSGKLDDAVAKRVIAHLEQCTECRAAAVGLSGDSFADWLHVNRAGGGAPADAPALSETQVAPSDVPAELRDHPEYTLLRELGRGGMGIVYLARHKLSHREEVLKVLNKGLLVQPEAVERFLREIRLASQLSSHPNVVTVYRPMHVGQLLVLVMEYVPGQDLAQLVTRKGCLAPANAACYVRQAAQGLQYAFEKGMVHRDVKPQNLMLTRDGKKHLVRILDFGLAKASRAQPGGEPSLTQTGIGMGTPAFMAPEQFLDVAGVDCRADVYGLGCTLYYLLTGHLPFAGRTFGEYCLAHHNTSAAPLTQLRPEVPEELAAVVAEMMKKDPAERYQTPGEVAKALAPFFKDGIKPLPAGDAIPTEVPAPPVPPHPGGGTRALLQPTLIEETQNATRAEGPKRWPAALAGLSLMGLLAVLVGLWVGGVFQAEIKKGPVAEIDKGPVARLPAKTKPGAVTKAEPEPALLEAPFDAATAQTAQQAWAGYLRRNVEEDVDLGNGVFLTMRLLPPGKFLMGSPEEEKGSGDERPQRWVTLTQPYYLGKYEVAQKQWQQLMGTTLREQRDAAKATSLYGEGDDFPTYYVNHEEATAFCKKLTERAAGRLPQGWEYRLPTEAQWEYGCRAGTNTAYAFGNDVKELDRHAWFDDNSGRSTHKVGGKQANGWGLHDMHGNVWEWCRDWYQHKGPGSTNPEVTKEASSRVLRGGCWLNPGRSCRSASRYGFTPDRRHVRVGFRVAAVQSSAEPR